MPFFAYLLQTALSTQMESNFTLLVYSSADAADGQEHHNTPAQC